MAGFVGTCKADFYYGGRSASFYEGCFEYTRLQSHSYSICKRSNDRRFQRRCCSYEQVHDHRQPADNTSYRSTFDKLHNNNIEIKEGLGLLTSAIIDQHFIVRSRYNRLLSALAKYPGVTCIGIDEATAIIVQGNKIKVAGDSQVVIIKKPEQLKVTFAGLIKVKNLQFGIYMEGDESLY